MLSGFAGFEIFGHVLLNRLGKHGHSDLVEDDIFQGFVDHRTDYAWTREGSSSEKVLNNLFHPV